MASDSKKTPITTRRGDGGYTSLWGGAEVPKYDLRPETYGAIDEATAVLGMARTMTQHEALRNHVVDLQRDLFRVMSELAAGRPMEGVNPVDAALVRDIEARIAAVRDTLDLPASFTVAATTNGAVLDMARTVIRRAERSCARMLHEGVIANQDVLRYLNRASDLAFVLARLDEKLSGVPYETISAADIE